MQLIFYIEMGKYNTMNQIQKLVEFQSNNIHTVLMKDNLWKKIKDPLLMKLIFWLMSCEYLC